MDNRCSPPPPATAGTPLDQARAAFEWLTRGPRPATIDGRAFPGLPARAVPVDEVRDRLTHPSCPAATRDAVWAHLVRRSRAYGSTWTVAAVGCALPALATVSTRLCRALPTDRTRDTSGPWGRRGVTGAISDIESAVLSAFLTELAVIDLRRPRILSRLRSAAHEAGRLARREIQRAPIPRAALFCSSPPPPPARHPDLVLARAVAAGAITRAQAALIGSTRLEPITLADVAHARGHTVRDVRAARVRAERQLAAFLRDTDPTATVLARPPAAGTRDGSRAAGATAGAGGMPTTASGALTGPLPGATSAATTSDGTRFADATPAVATSGESPEPRAGQPRRAGPSRPRPPRPDRAGRPHTVPTPRTTETPPTDPTTPVHSPRRADGGREPTPGRSRARRQRRRTRRSTADTATDPIGTDRSSTAGPAGTSGIATDRACADQTRAGQTSARPPTEDAGPDAAAGESCGTPGGPS